MTWKKNRSFSRNLTRAIFFTACFCSFAIAQTTPNPSSFSGIVTKEPGSQPLKKVLVQVIAETAGETYTASTDTDGHFRIDNIAPGRYRIYLEKSGLAGVNERGVKADTTVVKVTAGQSLDDLAFRMLATAVISGKVTDEDGDPMANVRVIALRKKPGKSGRESSAMAATNDLGEYRLPGLFPGQYSILAMPPPDFRDYETRREKSPPEDPAKPDTRYVNTYYPGTYDAAQASLLAVKAGDEMPVDLTLVPSRTYRVHGIVSGVSATEKPNVELFSKSGDSYHANEIGPDSQFDIRGVAPGSYVLKVAATRGTQALTAHQDVTVEAGDVDGLRITPQSSFSIYGHLRMEGAVADLTQYAANLRQADQPEDSGFFIAMDTFGANAPIDRLGNFTWKDIVPGTYIVQVFGSDGKSNTYLKSVTANGRDISTGFTASGPTGVDVVLSTKGGMIEGAVTTAEKDVDQVHPAVNASVIAIPEEKFRKLPDHYGSGATDQQGHFIIRGLNPGTYTLYAWQDVEDGLWRDPDFLKAQETPGTSAKIEEGSHQQVDFKLSSVPVDWR